MLGSLLADGLEITNEPEEADALIVNTCSFIDSAQEESVDTILESAELRATRRPGQALRSVIFFSMIVWTKLG